MKKSLSLLFLLTLISCAGETAAEFEFFLDREPQEVTERTISSLSAPEAVINFSEYDIYSPGTLAQNSTDLYLIDFGTTSIVRVSKQSFGTPEKLTFSEGSGPGEVQGIQSLAVSEDGLYVGDPMQSRIVETEPDGTPIRDISTEFSPNNLILTSENRLLNFNAHQQDHMFTFYHLDSDTTTGFEEIDFGFEEIMKYAGYLSGDDSSIYFAGYSEPLLRKYTTDGELLFSRSTIDNFDTTDFYEVSTRGEMRIAGFSDDALFSSMDVIHYEDYLIVIPSGNGGEDVNYLDVYDASSGEYLETYSLSLQPGNAAVDDQYLYLLVRDGDDNLLQRYSNPFQ